MMPVHERPAADLSDQEIIERLEQARQDEIEGRLVHCATENELRAFLLAVNSAAR
jgi:hypothetical protein